jgi:hypothetical protein
MEFESWERIYWMRKIEQAEQEIERLRKVQSEYRAAARMAHDRFSEVHYGEA